MDEWSKGWLASEDAEQDKIMVKRVYIDINDGNLTDGILFSQIMYWHGFKHGKPRLSIFRDGYLWLAKQFKDWWEECRIDERTAKRSMARLEKRGLIETRVWKFGENRTTHIRIIWERFKQLVLKMTDCPYTSSKVTNSPVAKGQFVTLQSDKKALSSYTETTAESTTENTKEQRTLSDVPSDSAPTSVVSEAAPTPIQETAVPQLVKQPQDATPIQEATKPKIDLWEYAMLKVWPGGGKYWRNILNMLSGRSKTGQWAEWNFEEEMRPKSPAVILAFKQFMETEEEYEGLTMPQKPETIYRYWGFFRQSKRFDNLVRIAESKLAAIQPPAESLPVPTTPVEQPAPETTQQSTSIPRRPFAELKAELANKLRAPAPRKAAG